MENTFYWNLKLTLALVLTFFEVSINRFVRKGYRAETIIELSRSFFYGLATLHWLPISYAHTPIHTRTACLGWVDGCVMQLALNAFSPIKYATQGLCLHFAYTLPCNMHPDRPYPTPMCLTMLCYQLLVSLSCVASVSTCHSQGRRRERRKAYLLHVTLPRIL